MEEFVFSLNQLSAYWGQWILRASISGGVAIAVVLLIFRMMPKLNPTVKVWAWRLVFAKFLVALVWVRPIEIPIFVDKNINSNPALSSLLDSTDQQTILSNSAATLETVKSMIKTPTSPEGSIWNLSFESYLMMIWAVSIIFLMGYIFRQIVHFQKKRRSLQLQYQTPLSNALDVVSKKLRVTTPPELLVSNYDSSPYLHGILKPAIILPSKKYSEMELKLIFAHELGHLKKKHLLWSWFPTIGFLLFFFHPLVWIARRELCLSQELEADEFAISGSGYGVKDYGNTLLKVIKGDDRVFDAALVTVHLAESFSALKRRFQSMKSIRPLTKRAMQIFVISSILIGSVAIIPWEIVALARSGKSFTSACSTIEKCIKYVSELTGEKYLFEGLKGKIQSSSNVQITKENAILLLTKALHLNGYSRVPLEDANTYQIIKFRDARDTLLPELRGSKTEEPKFPKNWDLYRFTYKAKHPEVVDQMARTARSFMPANSRIIPVELSGQVLITAAAPDIKNVYQIIRELDVRPSKALIQKWKRRAEERHKERMSQKFQLPKPKQSAKKK